MKPFGILIAAIVVTTSLAQAQAVQQDYGFLALSAQAVSNQDKPSLRLSPKLEESWEYKREDIGALGTILAERKAVVLDLFKQRALACIAMRVINPDVSKKDLIPEKIRKAFERTFPNLFFPYMRSQTFGRLEAAAGKDISSLRTAVQEVFSDYYSDPIIEEYVSDRLIQNEHLLLFFLRGNPNKAGELLDRFLPLSAIYEDNLNWERIRKIINPVEPVKAFSLFPQKLIDASKKTKKRYKLLQTEFDEFTTYAKAGLSIESLENAISNETIRALLDQVISNM